MINIHCIVIAYGLPYDLGRLHNRVDAPNIFWHVFLHSNIPEVKQACITMHQLTHLNRAGLYPSPQWPDCFEFYGYGVNRGLSRSWNEGIENAYQWDADVAIILNDDMLPGPGDVQRVAQAAVDHPEAGIVKCMGTDMRSGQRTPMEFGLTAITRRGWDVVGAFDENIWPIYWEDIDWDRRRMLAGLPVHIVEETTAVHAGSKTSVTVPGLLEQTNGWFAANEAYYRRKWGAIHTEGELYATPFNDSALGLKIDPSRRHRPYGPGYDREDVQHG